MTFKTHRFAFFLAAVALVAASPLSQGIAHAQDLSSVSGATTKTQGDFNLANRFSVEIDGVMVSGVHTIDGLEQETEIVEYKDGEDGTMHTRPGNHKTGKLTLTRDWSNTPEWFKAFNATSNGAGVRKSMSIIFHNDAGEEAGRLNFYNVWPSKWTGPVLNAKNSGHATEKIEVSWETMEMKPN